MINFKLTNYFTDNDYDNESKIVIESSTNDEGGTVWITGKVYSIDSFSSEAIEDLSNIFNEAGITLEECNYLNNYINKNYRQINEEENITSIEDMDWSDLCTVSTIEFELPIPEPLIVKLLDENEPMITFVDNEEDLVPITQNGTLKVSDFKLVFGEDDVDKAIDAPSILTNSATSYKILKAMWDAEIQLVSEMAFWFFKDIEFDLVDTDEE